MEKNILFCIKQKFWGSRNVLLPFTSTNSKPQISIFHATNDLTLGLFFLACPWTQCAPHLHSWHAEGQEDPQMQVKGFLL